MVLCIFVPCSLFFADFSSNISLKYCFVNKRGLQSRLPVQNLSQSFFCEKDSSLVRGSQYRLIFLFCTEDTVACITKARNNIFVLIEFFVKCCTINFNVRVSFCEYLKSFRSSNNTHKLN